MARQLELCRVMNGIINFKLINFRKVNAIIWDLIVHASFVLCSGTLYIHTLLKISVSYGCFFDQTAAAGSLGALIKNHAIVL